jgi:hypothetical protein
MDDTVSKSLLGISMVALPGDGSAGGRPADA